MFSTAAGRLEKCTLVSMDTDGFTVTSTTPDGAATQMYSLALRGVKARRGQFKQEHTGGQQHRSVVTGIGFKPALSLASNQNVSSAFALNNARYGNRCGQWDDGRSASIVDAPP